MRRLIFLGYFVAGLQTVIGGGLQGVDVGTPTQVRSDLTIQVSNTHTAPLTGLLICTRVYEGTNKRAEVLTILDSYVNRGYDSPIAPGSSAVFRLLPAHMVAGRKYEVVLKGAVFSDGFMAGVDDGAAVLVGRRQRLRDAISDYEIRLRDSRDAGELASAVLERISSTATLRKDAFKATDVHNAHSAVVFAAESLAQTWLSRVLTAKPEPCDGACSSQRIGYALGGLAVWKDHLEQGLSETHTAN